MHEALGKPRRGQRLNLKVRHGEKGFSALPPPTHSTVPWEPWQVGKDQLRLPDTIPGTSHNGIGFDCFKCGAHVIKDDIWKIKGTCPWTTYVPDSIVTGTSPIHNTTVIQLYNHFLNTR